MNIWEAIILGLIQGITEILPVSSTAHIILFTQLFGEEPDISFNVIMNFGSWIAIMIYFYDIWLDLVVGTLNFIKITIYTWLKENNKSKLKNKLPRFSRMTVDYEKNEFYHNSKKQFILGFNLILATIPVLVIAFFIKDFLNKNLENNFMIGVSLILGGGLLYIAEILSKQKYNIDNIGFGKIILIGFGQVMSLIPGFSRSGSTIMASLFVGLKRKDAATFAFLLGAPVILIATIVEIPSFINDYQISLEVILSFMFSIIGTLVSIHILYKFIQKQSFLVFVIYRFILGGFLIINSI